MTDRPCTLRPGVHVQCYRDTLRGRDKLATLLDLADQWITAGVVGVVLHGFTGELTRDRFEAMAGPLGLKGLQVSTSFGLGDRNSDNPNDTAAALAAVANSTLCASMVIDAEAAYENETSDRPNTAVLATRYRELAPDAYTIVQCWPDYVGHRTYYPWVELARMSDVLAPMDYFNNWRRQHGRRRVSVLIDRWRAQWGLVDAKLATEGIVRPRISTLQGYQWDDVPAGLARMLLEDPLARRAPLPSPLTILWAEPTPDVATMRVLRALRVLRETHGLTGPDAVRQFQVLHNAAGGTLTVDGLLGPMTLDALLSPAPSRGEAGTGRRVLALAETQLGKRYVLGVTAPKNDPDGVDAYDCAELVAWALCQADPQRRLYGCTNNSAPLERANAFSGAFVRDARELGVAVSIDEAVRIPGAVLFRAPRDGRMGHVAISDGRGGTVEAMDPSHGVARGRATGRDWTGACLVPWLTYEQPA